MAAGDILLAEDNLAANPSFLTSGVHGRGRGGRGGGGTAKVLYACLVTYIGRIELRSSLTLSRTSVSILFVSLLRGILACAQFVYFFLPKKCVLDRSISPVIRNKRLSDLLAAASIHPIVAFDPTFLPSFLPSASFCRHLTPR